MINPNVTAVLEAAAKGQCDVPDEALAAHRALSRFREARKSAGIGTASARVATELPVDKLLDDLAAGTALTADYFEKVHQDVQAAERQKALAQLFDAAEGTAQRTVMSTVESNIATTIKSLEPRLMTLLDEARAVVAQLGDVERTEAAVVRAPDSRVRKAWLELDGLGERYTAMRALYTVMLSLDGSQTGGPPLRCFGAVRAVPAVWPDWELNTTPPWPTDPGKFLLFCVDSQADPWMPTPRQLDRAVQEAAAQRRDAQFADITGGSA